MTPLRHHTSATIEIPALRHHPLGNHNASLSGLHADGFGRASKLTEGSETRRPGESNAHARNASAAASAMSVACETYCRVTLSSLSLSIRPSPVLPRRTGGGGVRRPGQV